MSWTKILWLKFNLSLMMCLRARQQPFVSVLFVFVLFYFPVCPTWFLAHSFWRKKKTLEEFQTGRMRHPWLILIRDNRVRHAFPARGWWVAGDDAESEAIWILQHWLLRLLRLFCKMPHVSCCLCPMSELNPPKWNHVFEDFYIHFCIITAYLHFFKL